MAMREARSRRQAGRVARLCNDAHGRFGSNPKGTGALERHSSLPSLPRHPVLASSSASIGAPCHPFALAGIVGADHLEAALDLAHPSTEPKPLARVYGEPLTELPQDLYIPPEALEVFLETFEGPLDLLLYLIRRQNINVLDVPMAELTRQYLGYVEMMRRTQLELAAEYLLMAAVLIEIKSRLLLPRPPAAPGAEPEDPRAELVRRLLEYEKMKQAARELDALPLAERDFATVRVWFDRLAGARLPDVAPEDLRSAWAGLIARARANRHHLVTREQLSVRSEMSRLLKVLQPARYVEFTTLFAERADVAHLVVTFLALLELARERLVGVTQAEPYAPIYAQLRGEVPFALAADTEA